MSDFTYEAKDRKEVLETYEWDNVWIEQANNKTADRALYIGDSISCGTRRVATEMSGETVLFDGFGTSKAVDNPYLCESIALFIRQLPKLQVILFNNGLHGFHLSDDTAYAGDYEKIVRFLTESYPATPVYIVLTTDVCDSVRSARVKVRNEVAKAVAEKYGLPIIDLYRVSQEHKELLSQDGVHFTAEGYEKLAEEILKTLKNKD